MLFASRATSATESEKSEPAGRKSPRRVLDRMILFGENGLRNAIREFVAHYHLERNHQGLDNCLFTPLKPSPSGSGIVQRRERLGGMLNYYYREAA
jgi:hypothetical protein